MAGGAVAGMPAGLLDFQSRRKDGSRHRMLAAAADIFGARGYVPASVEEIALAAGVSRMTFYRHFSGKAEIAIELFRHNARAHLPRIAAIGQCEYWRREVVLAWLHGIFATDREQRSILQAFIQANVIEAGFGEHGHVFIGDIIAALGQHIPAFARGQGAAADRRQVEARLLIYEVLDQSSHAARNRGVAADGLLVEVLADRFIAFTRR